MPLWGITFPADSKMDLFLGSISELRKAIDVTENHLGSLQFSSHLRNFPGTW